MQSASAIKRTERVDAPVVRVAELAIQHSGLRKIPPATVLKLVLNAINQNVSVAKAHGK